MQSKNIVDVFIGLWNQNKLGPLYLIRPPLLQPDRSLDEWSKELECAFLMENYGVSKERALEKANNGHPDILHIYKEQTDKFYKVDNVGITELFKMQAHNSVELNKRIVFIHDGELIKETLSNKLLKVLEDPKKDTTIFILNNSQKEMLQTIESRSIKLSLNPTQEKLQQNDATGSFYEDLNRDLSENHKEFVEHMLNHSLSDAIEYLQKSEQCFESYTRFLYNFAKHKKVNIEFRERLLTCTQKDRDLRTFYTHNGARIYPWVQLVQYAN